MFRCGRGFPLRFRVGPHRQQQGILRWAQVLPSSKLHVSARNAGNEAKAKPFSSIPGPKIYPVVGCLPEIAKIEKKGRIHAMKEMEKMFVKYGPIYKTDMGVINSPNVFIKDPNDVATLFRAEGKLPSRLLEIENRMKWIHEKIDVPMFMFFTTGNDWKKIRSSMSKQIIPHRVAMFTPSLYAAAAEVTTVLHSKRNNSGVVEDVRPDLQKWALKGVTRFLFDIDLDVFSGENSFAEEVCRVSVNFVASIAKILQSLPFYYLYKTKNFVEYKKGVYRMHNLGQQILRSKYNKIQDAIAAGGMDDSVKLSVMEQLLVDGALTEKEAISQMCDLVAAGVDTTSTTASFVIHEVAKSPELQIGLRNEVVQIVGINNEPSFEQLQKLTLIRNTVRETLRLHSVVNVIFRRPVHEIVLSGYKIPAGTNVFFDMKLTSQNPDIFPEPGKFNPYRWTRRGAPETNPFANLPFGFGPRMCYGRRLAELELHLLLTRLVQKYKMTTDQDQLEKVASGIIQSKDPVRVKFEEW